MPQGVAAVVVVLLTIGLLAACDDGDDGSSNEAEPTVEDALTTAEELCPSVDPDFFEACVSNVVVQSGSARVAVLCTNSETGEWYMATPGATPAPDLGQDASEAEMPGEDCRQPGHVAVALVGGGEIIR